MKNQAVVEEVVVVVEEEEEATGNTETIHGPLMKRSSRKLHPMPPFSKQGDLWRFTIDL